MFAPQHTKHSYLQDEELIREALRSPQSEMEIELAQRFSECLDETADIDAKGILSAAEEHSLDASEIRALGEAIIEDVDTTVAMINVLGAHDFEDSETLKKAMKLIEILDQHGISSKAELEALLAKTDGVAIPLTPARQSPWQPLRR